MLTRRATLLTLSLSVILASGFWAIQATAQSGGPPKTAKPTKPKAKAKKPDFPPFAEVTKGYEKVVSTADGKASMYTLWMRKKDGQMLAGLPRSYSRDRYFIALTVASGERFAGLQMGDRYVYWKRYDKRLALIEPNIGTRSTGDQESKSSVQRLYTDRVILDIPIVTMGPGGGPVIDLDDLLLSHASKFFGRSVTGMNRKLAEIKTAKAFPQNVEIAYEVPMSGGRLKTIHYSFSILPTKTGYKPRKADARVGYFTTSYQDLGKYSDDETWTRFINRWHLEKADPSLKMSPPKRPIVFYVEHTTPIRYRRFVRDGILYWNKAFEKIGIVNAMEVHYQDERTGTHMDKDPEDVRYNFIRWLNNDIGTAIGPSRVNPKTGQILDADVILTDGWIRAFDFDFHKLLPEIVMEGLSAETLVWLEENPNWDPRFLLADPAERRMMLAERERLGAQPFGGHPMANLRSELLGDDEYDGLVGRVSQVNGLCMAATGKAFDLALLRMTQAMAAAALQDDDDEDDDDEDENGKEKKKTKKKKKKSNEDLLDGMPAKFIGPLLADLVAHEVGHTLGLRHNFKASSLYTLEQINSDEVAGKKPFTSSVMDYTPININMDENATQGDYAMIAVGPYDMWAIEYGYTFDKDLKPILARCTEPENQYLTDEDTSGPDPLARRYDFSADPLTYANNQAQLALHHRERILSRFVNDGDSWAKARQGYDFTLGLQFRAVSMMANWLGGAFVNRDKKGDTLPGSEESRPPITVVSAKKQRDALRFIIEHTFADDAFGLTPELLQHMTVDKWFDGGGRAALFQDATYPLHDRIMGIQASVLTRIMNPTTLGRIYDNEYRTMNGDDSLTLPEVMESVLSEIWKELGDMPSGRYSARQPLISSMRRNLQRESIDRLIGLTMQSTGGTAAFRAISSLSLMHLSRIQERIQRAAAKDDGSLDPYTYAHLTDLGRRIDKALEAHYVLNGAGRRGR